MDLPIYLSFVSSSIVGLLVVYWLSEASFSSGLFRANLYTILGVFACPGGPAGYYSGG
jgi:hypothetical protein